MRNAIFAGAACALALLAPTFSRAASSASQYEVGALAVEQLQGKDERKGAPIIFIPGLASGSWAWKDSAERLRTTHAVYLLTLPGFDGRKPVAGTTFETLCGDLQKLIETRHIQHPVLVGHSLGGTLALSFAAGHSD